MTRAHAAGALLLALLLYGAPGSSPAARAATASERLRSAEAVEAPRWTPTPTARPATAAFTLRVGALVVPLRLMALAVLPGGTVEIRREGHGGGPLSATAGGGRLRSAGADAWTWTAPNRPGFHSVRFVSTQPVDTMQLTFMVARPATEVRNGALNG